MKMKKRNKLQLIGILLTAVLLCCSCGHTTRFPIRQNIDFSINYRDWKKAIKPAKDCDVNFCRFNVNDDNYRIEVTGDEKEIAKYYASVQKKHNDFATTNSDYFSDDKYILIDYWTAGIYPFYVSSEIPSELTDYAKENNISLDYKNNQLTALTIGRHFIGDSSIKDVTFHYPVVCIDEFFKYSAEEDIMSYYNFSFFESFEDVEYLIINCTSNYDTTNYEKKIHEMFPNTVIIIQ